jgi:hypothetical protein
LTTSPKASLNADYVRTEISRWQARSMTISTRGIVSAESPLAAQAGAVVLARGGHHWAARFALVTIAIAIAAFVGASRIYLRAHYLSDVVGGFGLGATTFSICGMGALVVAFLRHNGSRT